jgi:uncharacterized SAM-binding protein YcdF (DUF218 family)
MYREFLKQIEDFIFVEDKPEKADIIFVPGNGYPQMAEQAARLYRLGYAPYILPSGRYSVVTGKFSGVLAKKEIYSGEFSTEWQFLREVLLKNGVPDRAILKEDGATFTYENAIYSRKVTDQEKISVETAILCCKTYHARRALMYYQRLYPQARFLVCPSDVDGITRSTWFETEEGISEVTAEVKRILTQFSIMMDKEK